MDDPEASDPALWGNRSDHQAKGYGYLGPLARPDGGLSSELTFTAHINGKPVDIPSIVPTLTPDEVSYMMRAQSGVPLPESIKQKAIAYAQQRLAQGKPVYANPEEQNLSQYPQFLRTPVTPPGATFLAGSHPTARAPETAPNLADAIKYLIERSSR